MDAASNIEAIHELSPQQEGMLFELLRRAEDELFIEVEIHALPSALDIEVFHKAWSYLMKRHAILRTAFVWKNRSKPLQVVFADVAPPITVEDWRQQPTYRRHSPLEDYLAADRKKGFDLSAAPLLRLALRRVTDETYQLIWTQHHILFDGWSRAVLLEEFVSAYSSFETATAPNNEPPLAYGRYIEWLKHQDLSTAESFWRSTLTGFARATALGRPRRFATTSPRERFGEIDIEFSAAEAARLNSAARHERVTLAAVLHGAWALILSRYSGDADVVFGSTVAGRPADLPGAQSTIGLFINTVPFRIPIEPSADTWAWLRQVQAQLLAIRDYEFCSAGQIHQWSELSGSSPLYESILVIENYPMRHLANPPVPVGRGRFIGARTPYPLALIASAQHDLIMRAVFESRRVNRFAATRILEHLRVVLKRLASGPDCSVIELQRLIPDYAIPQVLSAAQGQTLGGTRPPYIAPGRPVEKKLLAIAGKVLGIDGIGLADRFFSLGGHSLLATQLISRVQQAFQVDVPMRVLFESTDMKTLADFIENAVFLKIESLSEEEAQSLLEWIG